MENYEERYNKLVNFIKDLYPHTSDYVKEKLEGCIPELRESEDERIRKELLEHCLNRRDGKQICVDASDYRRWAAWLEKQGEQKPTLRERYENIAKSEWFKKTYDGMSISDEEPKPTDEEKPKFKIGDWITNGEYTWKITDIKPLDYILQSQNGDMIDDNISYVDENFRLWTIQDAKEGDVLCYEDEMFMLKNYVLLHEIVYHCCYDGKNFIPHSIYSLTKDDFNNIHPATKEQRDLLFSKMKEAGYEWDAEKRELNKIEQTSTWSEDDEKMKSLIISTLTSMGTLNLERYYHMNLDEVKNWLKSIKPNHWRPSEEQMKALKYVVDYFGELTEHFAEYEEIKSLYDDFKKL